MINFWDELKKPILCLAPMADVTDATFRFIISKHSKKGNYFPFITYTEFVSADGLCLAPEKGRKKLLKDLEYSKIERPIVAQFFTGKPEMMEEVAKLAKELGFDGVDINMGCPDKSVEKQGAGAALMKSPKLAREIIAAAKAGAGGLPVSVKTRLGYNTDELEEWLPELLAENPAAIIIHARTRKEMSKVPARWERIKDVVEIRNRVQGGEAEKTLIIGNGDVWSVENAFEKCRETGADGAMLGRAIFGKPWLFAESEPSAEGKINILIEHIKLFDEKFSGVKSFAVMKKHFKAYLPDNKKLSSELMQTKDAEGAVGVLTSHLRSMA